jgi:hypothetical protein
MCQSFTFSFPACKHQGENEIRRCAAEHCTETTHRIISSDLLEFCPECFLLADPRSALPEDSPFKQYAGANIEENRAWANIGREANFWFVRDTYVRAGFFSDAAVFRDENIPLFVAADGSKLGEGRKKILSDLHRFLIWDFWERLNADCDSKATREQKIFLLQLQNVLEVAEIDRPVLWVSGLPFVSEEDLENTASCSICHEPFGVPNEDSHGKLHRAVAIPTCGHVFGDDCLLEWAITSNTCPMCRGPMNPSQPITPPNRELMEFRNYRNEIETIEKEGTPQWMLSLLGAVEAGLLELHEAYARLQHQIELLTRLCEAVVGHEALAEALADIERERGQ